MTEQPDRTLGDLIAAEATCWVEDAFAGDYSDFTWGLLTFNCGRECNNRVDPARAALIELTGVSPLEAESVATDTGFDIVETWLVADPGLDMVIGLNDAGALGAYEAFVASGLELSDRFIAGQDGQLDAIELIAEGGGVGGSYRASAALPLDQIGRSVVDLPANLLEGLATGNVLIDGELITTAEQAEEFLSR